MRTSRGCPIGSRRSASAAEPRYIRTVPGVGYVFGSPVEEPVVASFADLAAEETS